MKKKIFIDIGNTNIKMLENDRFSFFNIKNINNIFNKPETNANYFISCNNIKYYKNIEKMSNLYQNITLIKNDFFSDLITLENGIKIDEIGIDILLQIYWLVYVKKEQNGIILSSGTYLTCVSIRNSSVVSINISCGFEKLIADFEDTIGTKIEGINYSLLGTDNYSAIFSSFLLKIFGLINYNISMIKSDNVIFTGLGFNNNMLNLIKENNLVKFKYEEYITLQSLKRIYNKG